MFMLTNVHLLWSNVHLYDPNSSSFLKTVDDPAYKCALESYVSMNLEEECSQFCPLQCDFITYEVNKYVRSYLVNSASNKKNQRIAAFLAKRNETDLTPERMQLRLLLFGLFKLILKCEIYLQINFTKVLGLVCILWWNGADCDQRSTQNDQDWIHQWYRWHFRPLSRNKPSQLHWAHWVFYWNHAYIHFWEILRSRLIFDL